jgi:rubrerythrin
MPSEASQIEAIGLMAAHESALAELYRTCARQFPEHQDFWSRLAEDEVRHARWVAGFADDVKRGTAEVNPGRFESESMLASLDAVKERRAEAQTGEPSLLDALSSAKKFEDELIESRYFEIFDEDAPGLKALLRRLQAETLVHRRRVTEAWEKKGGKTF